MITYCILKLATTGNSHLTLQADGTFVKTDGAEKPILFLAIDAAESFMKWQKLTPLKYHICRWG